MTTTFNLGLLNDWADFWYSEIGVNVIPANTKDKKTFENWIKWQDQSILLCCTTRLNNIACSCLLDTSYLIIIL